MFEYEHRIQFFETDLMKVVHHANYLRIAEEARVAWGVAHGLIDWQDSTTALSFAVLSTQVRHLRPARFGDLLKVQLQVRLVRVRFEFQYKLWNNLDLVAEIVTEHAVLDEQLAPKRPTVKMKKILEKELWNETWLLSL